MAFVRRSSRGRWISRLFLALPVIWMCVVVVCFSLLNQQGALPERGNRGIERAAGVEFRDGARDIRQRNQDGDVIEAARQHEFEHPHLAPPPLHLINGDDETETKTDYPLQNRNRNQIEIEELNAGDVKRRLVGEADLEMRLKKVGHGKFFNPNIKDELHQVLHEKLMEELYKDDDDDVNDDDDDDDDNLRELGLGGLTDKGVKRNAEVKEDAREYDDILRKLGLGGVTDEGPKHNAGDMAGKAKSIPAIKAIPPFKQIKDGKNGLKIIKNAKSNVKLPDSIVDDDNDDLQINKDLAVIAKLAGKVKNKIAVPNEIIQDQNSNANFAKNINPNNANDKLKLNIQVDHADEADQMRYDKNVQGLIKDQNDKLDIGPPHKANAMNIKGDLGDINGLGNVNAVPNINQQNVQHDANGKEIGDKDLLGDHWDIVKQPFENKLQRKKLNPASVANDLEKKERQARMERLKEEKDRVLRRLGQLKDRAPQKDKPGDMGEAIIIDKEKLSPEERRKFDQGWKDNKFNQYASDLIGVHRDLPDMRHSKCLKMPMPKKLPSSSVIIIFHNEAWSALLRTVHSVLERTEPELLHQIVLVDDGSTKDHLGVELDEYVAALGEKVVLVRTKKREGLIRARLLGAKIATGTILTFLDSHCEVTEGWLQHLVEPIDRNWKTVTVPLIDNINLETLSFSAYTRSGMGVNMGGFLWDLSFYWFPVPKQETKAQGEVDNIRSPTMAGGLFSISKDYFEHLGAYDPGFEIWGGENLELSFKIWMCAGTLLTVPCSHVGHIFRKSSPYSWKVANSTINNPLRRNSMRLAEVWMDEYKYFFYELTGFKGMSSLGDISERIALRQKLGCRSFDWYMNNIWPTGHNPKHSKIRGQLENRGLNKCFSAISHIPAKVERGISFVPCAYHQQTQHWELTDRGEIKRHLSCLDWTGSVLQLSHCNDRKDNTQTWMYTSEGRLYHPVSKKCLAARQSHKIELVICSQNDPAQQWTWHPVSVPADYFRALNVPVPRNTSVNALIGL